MCFCSVWSCSFFIELLLFLCSVWSPDVYWFFFFLSGPVCLGVASACPPQYLLRYFATQWSLSCLVYLPISTGMWASVCVSGFPHPLCPSLSPSFCVSLVVSLSFVSLCLHVLAWVSMWVSLVVLFWQYLISCVLCSVWLPLFCQICSWCLSTCCPSSPNLVYLSPQIVSVCCPSLCWSSCHGAWGAALIVASIFTSWFHCCSMSTGNVQTGDRMTTACSVVCFCWQILILL